MAAVEIGVSALIFGFPDANANSCGYFESLDFAEEVEETVVKDGDGDIIAAAHHGKTQKVSGTYVWKDKGSGTPDNEVGTGTAIALACAGDSDYPASGSIYVTSCKTAYSQDGFKKIDFEGVKYPNLL